MIILTQFEWCTMRLPFRTKPNRLTDLEIRDAMAQLQALRTAVEAAERKAGLLPHNDNIAPNSASADPLKSRGRGSTY
ncbi:hypothetical protein [Bradyrhizobium sp. McL0616]|uniref:hypothetical protein n=1 Tax=Bradyrhizobium sp. McL0616 TaxID=3415674 RepID=UPI003CED2DF7